MNPRHAFRVFAKDGRELLRDRRTIFVNVLLPVLLYPLLAVVAIQVLELSRPGPTEWPRLAMADLPAELRELLHRDPPAEADRGAVGAPAGLRLTNLPPGAIDELRDLASASEAGDARATGRIAERLRNENLVAVLCGPSRPPAPGNPWQVLVLADNANPAYGRVRRRVEAALDRWEERLVDRRLAARDLDADLVRPVVRLRLQAATGGESARSLLGGIIPFVLVLLAMVGCFLPALDLLAGERERGTLETLCSLPCGRREIFVGKLLVVLSAGLATVLLNLLSLGTTVWIAVSALPRTGAGAEDLLGAGLTPGTLGLCFAVLLPLCVSLAAFSLALAGLARSFKEANNYLSPFALAVLLPALLVLLPQVRAAYGLDLLPVLGPMLALKAALQEPSVPWDHLLLAFAASLALAVLVVGWATRLLESESFLYPGLVRAGWGLLRRFGPRPPVPGGLEAMGVFALAVGGFIGTSLLLPPAPEGWLLVPHCLLPFYLGLLLPVLVHQMAGSYAPSESLLLRLPARRHIPSLVLVVLLAPLASQCAGLLQEPLLPETVPGLEELERLVHRLDGLGGAGLLLACLALTPGICEELLCRGVLLTGLRRSLGAPMAVAVSSVCFAAIHLSPYRFFPQLLLGVILAATALRTRSIVSAMLVHALHNAWFIVAPPLDGPGAMYRLPAASPWLPAQSALAAVGLCLCLLAAWLALDRPGLRARPA